MPPVTRSQIRNVQAIAHTVDAQGSPIKIVPSATGQGTRTIWVYPAASPDVEETESTAPVRASVSAWPTLSTLSSLTDSMSSIESDRPQTPDLRASWTAGSAITTPKKLQRSPDRIGGHSIDFWRNGSGVVVRDIIDGAGVSQNSHTNVGGSETQMDEQSGVDSQNYIDQMKLLMERREAALAAWTAAQSHDHEYAGVFEDSPPGAGGGPGLGPEGTVLISENASSYAGDTDIETDDEELADLQRQHNLQARALGLEPTILVGPGHYQPPTRILPRWSLIGQGRELAARPLGGEPTELVL